MCSDSYSDPNFQRLRWQCRRGLLELDCIFEQYLEQHYPHAPEDERRLFRQMLTEQDPDLQAWLLFGEPHPAVYAPLVTILRAD